MLSPYVCVRIKWPAVCSAHFMNTKDPGTFFFVVLEHLARRETHATSVKRYFPADLGNLLSCARQYF